MSLDGLDIFKKQAVTRQSGTSILTSLLSSPKTTCSSPELPSPSDVCLDSESSSRTDGSSPPPRTPPRKACISFIAAQPKSSPSYPRLKSKGADRLDSLSDESHLHDLDTFDSPVAAKKTRAASPLQTPPFDNLPMLGSVFDEYAEDRASPIIRDNYQAGQPKKLIDDCLKKEMALRVLPVLDDGDDENDIDEYISEEDDEMSAEEPDEERDHVHEDDKLLAEDSNGGSTKNSKDAIQLLSRKFGLKLDLSNHQQFIASHSIYTPSRDIVDNFVPGTLDEDQSEAKLKHGSPISLHDIDPTYPSENDDEFDVQPTLPKTALISPVRFLPKIASPRRRLHSVQTPRFSLNPKSMGLSRTLSLPWGRNQRYSRHQSIQAVSPDSPPVRTKCSAIAISKSIEHRRHHRRGKKGEWNKEKCNGAEAMAAMAKQLAGRSLGVLASSI